jgi:mRNA interferase MazF
MPFEFGAIVLVPFPFTDQSASKRRPAVVVSAPAYAAERPDIVIMAVTSQLRPSPSFGETWIDDWEAAGLLKPSAVKPVLATLDQRLVLRALGVLAPGDRAALRTSLSAILG